MTTSDVIRRIIAKNNALSATEIMELVRQDKSVKPNKSNVRFRRLVNKIMKEERDKLKSGNEYARSMADEHDSVEYEETRNPSVETRNPLPPRVAIIAAKDSTKDILGNLVQISSLVEKVGGKDEFVKMVDFLREVGDISEYLKALSNVGK